MHTETERKFLVASDSYKQEAYKSLHIVQGYLSSVPERTVRIRISGEQAYITIKGISNESGTTRFEWEKEIPVAEAQMLIKLCEPGVIDKIRYLVKVDNHLFEVDEFSGENDGLVIAEIELQDEKEAFAHPAWLGKEVTGDKRYYNASLTRNPYNKWKDGHDKSAGKNT
ncbi:CYTH domain-containing protein [Dysgonomonas sp. 25]|uniref:CYTH domain-containing protein n=1 Tax=Dysgonomonas sp. 25 TaxID=2302933 RepID=UPI0013D6BFF7|nr:CYTH domain-containing protein [Dysgonomonas sp. 25]NDV68688.1 CYTH domain-containing protein [Dysgonomonas sp. 25]